MGIQKDQLLTALGISKGYQDKEVADLEARFNATIQALYQVVTNNRQDPIVQLDEEVGLQDTPIGHVMAYMGKNAPKHYLACDGAIYNIADYPFLSQHILKEFETVNHFGGDGITTFAVPDLRGEFLRGTGRNNHGNQGDGADVGKHQNATQLPMIDTANTPTGNVNTCCRHFIQSGNASVSNLVYNMDKAIGTPGAVTQFSTTVRSTEAWVKTYALAYTTRPTNTSVLYVIKAEPTYYLKADSNAGYYSEEEVCIGSYKGHPLYRKLFTAMLTSTNRNHEVDVSGIIPSLSNVINIRARFNYNGAVEESWVVTDSFWGHNNDNFNVAVSKNRILCISIASDVRTPAMVDCVMEYTKTSGNLYYRLPEIGKNLVPIHYLRDIA